LVTEFGLDLNLEVKSKLVNNTAVEAYLAPAVNLNTPQCVVVTQSLV